jgi:hypothetical protein
MTTFSTFATATFATGNIVVVQSAENMIPGLPISFTGNTFGNVTANATFYIGNITFGFPTSNITLTSLPGGAVYALANGSGNMMATFSQGGQQIIPTVPPGEPLNQAFDAVNVNFDQIWAAGPVGSNIQIDQNTILTLNTNGNLVLNPNGIGNVIANAHVIPDQDRVRNLGAPVLRWNTVYAQNFVGNGGGISNITVSNISNGSTNVTTLANANITVTVAGTANVAVFTPNGLLINGTVSSTGNITAPTFIGNLVGNITGNIDAGGANTQVQFNDNDLLAGTPGFTFNKTTNAVGIAGTVTAGNILTGGTISAVGNVSANYYFGNGSQLTGITADNVNADDLIGNILSGNVLYSNLITVGNLVSLSVTGNTITGNLNTAGFISATGNVTANYFFGNGSQLTGIDATSIQNGNSNVKVLANANVTVSVDGTSNIAVFSSDGLKIAGNISATGNISGGNLYFGSGVVSGTGNIYADKIFANIVGNIDAAGNLYEVQFNTTGDQLGASANFTYNSANNVLTVSSGNIAGGNLIANSVIAGNKVIPAVGNVNVANVNINNVLDPVQAQDAATKLYVDTVAGGVTANVLGNLINMGSNTQGQLISNAVSLTTTTKVTDGIALLNQVLGKLVPPAPPAFPASQSIAISSISTYRMANITQVNNTANSLTVAAGATVTTVRRAATYSTNTITTAGPGDAGTITTYRNGVAVGNVTLNPAATPSANGTYGGGNLIISNNFDYNSANSNIAAGFWYVFSASISGSSAPAGWNDIVIFDTSAGNTNIASWYYDASSPSTPSYSSTTMTPPGSSTLLYSSTIPHYTNVNQFTIGTTVANVSGNLYPTSNVMATGTSAGSFAAPASVTYAQSNLGTNVIASFATASFTTTANVTTGFGGSSTGPSISVNNSYSTGTLTLTTALGNTVLYKSGTATAIDEGNIVVTTVGTGSGNAVRIVNPGTGNTPVYTANSATFNSQSSTLQTYDATVVGIGSQGVLKHDQTNYSTGYLPVGPDLSAGRSGTQYFTFKFVRTDVSKFDITYAGNVAGMWVALPGSVIDSSSGANGWINMAVAYAGAGYPGINSPGNGSDGCALGGTVSLNTTVASTSKTCTFGTVSSSSTVTNEIYVRIALTSGQTVTGLSLKAASN